jgi:L-glyceraldehyde 3-phosphate reductase
MNDAFDSALLMPRRRCGRSGLSMSALALTLDATACGEGSLAAARSIMHEALDWNINHIDLASGDQITRHAAESLIGSLFEQELKGHRDELIITAVAGARAWPGPYGAGGGRKHIFSSLDRTLGRLGLDHVDVLCAGPPDQDTALDETMSAVGDAIRIGKALYAGVSGYTALQTREAIYHLDRLGVRLAVHHVDSTIFSAAPDVALTNVVETRGVGAIRHFRRPAGARPRTYREVLLSDLARERRQTPTQLAIAWSLQQPSLASVSVSAASVHHLLECLAALEQLSFTPVEQALLGDRP